MIKLVFSIAVVLAVVVAVSTHCVYGYGPSIGQALLVAAHGVVINLFIGGVVLAIIASRYRKRETVDAMLRELDSLRGADGSENGQKVRKLIGELSHRGVTNMPLYKCVLASLDLSGIVLDGSNLRDADLDGAWLRATSFDDAQLTRASLQSAEGPDSKFRGADLRGAVLTSCRLRGADFTDADLSGADFSGANLRSAVFAGAVLSKVVLKGANLAGADLRGVRDLDVDRLKSVKSLEGAELDDTPRVEALMDNHEYLFEPPRDA